MPRFKYYLSKIIFIPSLMLCSVVDPILKHQFNHITCFHSQKKSVKFNWIKTFSISGKIPKLAKQSMFSVQTFLNMMNKTGKFLWVFFKDLFWYYQKHANNAVLFPNKIVNLWSWPRKKNLVARNVLLYYNFNKGAHSTSRNFVSPPQQHFFSFLWPISCNSC